MCVVIYLKSIGAAESFVSDHLIEAVVTIRLFYISELWKPSIRCVRIESNGYPFTTMRAVFCICSVSDRCSACSGDRLEIIYSFSSVSDLV